MPAEIFWLVLISAYTSLLWIPYATIRIARIGWVRVFMDPLPGDDPFEKAWAHRAYRAHMNAFEGLITFTPIALSVVATGTSNQATELSAAIYFAARFLHAPIYILKVPILRLLTFMVGLGATLVMAWEIIAHADWTVMFFGVIKGVG